ncbi:MAG: hypothetical protein ACD_7C00550G0001 [uncultured bacterium]|nr:MAG: hypothetical protein ACD_7C00550G0001 [uncultured bacterium]
MFSSSKSKSIELLMSLERPFRLKFSVAKPVTSTSKGFTDKKSNGTCFNSILAEEAFCVKSTSAAIEESAN